MSVRILLLASVLPGCSLYDGGDDGEELPEWDGGIIRWDGVITGTATATVDTCTATLDVTGSFEPQWRP